MRKLCVSKPWRKEPLAWPRYRRQCAIKVDITRMLTNGLVWLKTGKSGGLFWIWEWNFGLCFWKNCRLVGGGRREPLFSQEEFCSRKSVSQPASQLNYCLSGYDNKIMCSFERLFSETLHLFTNVVLFCAQYALNNIKNCVWRVSRPQDVRVYCNLTISFLKVDSHPRKQSRIVFSSSLTTAPQWLTLLTFIAPLSQMFWIKHNRAFATVA